MPAYRGGESSKLIPCGTCGTFIDPRSATYSLDGKLSCDRCAASFQIDAAQVRSFQTSSSNPWLRVAVIVGLVLLKVLIRLC